MDILLIFALFAMVIWAAFWVIRLAVRYGVDDALRRPTGTASLSRNGDPRPGGGKRLT